MKSTPKPKSKYFNALQDLSISLALVEDGTYFKIVASFVILGLVIMLFPLLLHGVTTAGQHLTWMAIGCLSVFVGLQVLLSAVYMKAFALKKRGCRKGWIVTRILPLRNVHRILKAAVGLSLLALFADAALLLAFHYSALGEPVGPMLVAVNFILLAAVQITISSVLMGILFVE